MPIILHPAPSSGLIRITRRINFANFLLASTLAVFAFQNPEARAATVVMNASDAITESSFNSGLHWTGGVAPVATNAYQTSMFMLRTPEDTNSLAFAGGSLEVQSGGTLRDKTAGTITVTNLILDNTATLELTQPNGVNASTATGTLAGGITLNGTAVLHAGLSGDTPGEVFIISAIIGGTGGFTTTGSSGSIILAATNTYTGLTTVNAGSLGGTGIISGPVTVTGTGTLSPGGTTNRTLTISNTLTLAGVVSMKINKAGANLTSDLIQDISTLNYGGTLAVTATGDALTNGDAFTLFAAATYSNVFSAYNLPVLAAGLTWDTSQLNAGRIAVKTGQTVPAFPYLDPMQTPDARAADLISRMTLAEKAAQLYYDGSVNTRLGIPNYGGWNQCLHGVSISQPSTLFPVSIAAAATWDPALVSTETSAISDEARAFNQSSGIGLIYRAPVINISRNPYWGRIQECFGEDPWLTSRIGVSYLQGLQGTNSQYLKIAGTLKHFAAYNVEDGRATNDAIVPERWLYEYWLPHWKACATEGKAQSVMASYNLINGTHNAANHLLLTDILRSKWNFKGFVVSDLGGINNMITVDHIFPDAPTADSTSLPAGCDYDDTQYRDGITVAVTNGTLSEAVVDQALTRLLKVAFRLGVFDPPALVPYSQIGTNVVRSSTNIALSLKVAQSAIVLLKNQNNFLPLNTNHVNSIAVIGPLAATFLPGNYYSGPVTSPVTPQQGFINRAAPGTQVVTAPGCGISTTGMSNQLSQAIQAATNAQVVIMCLGTDLSIEAEGLDRTALELPAAQESLLQTIYAANTNLVLVLLNAGPLAIPWAKTNAPAILEAWYAGEQGGNAIADVVFGNVNPGGKLPYTVYPSSTVPGLPPQNQYDVSQGFTYMFFTNQALFPFGHGLSYTTFGYSNLVFSVQTNTPDDILNVSVDVWNTGAVAGDEVAQVYVHDAASGVVQAIKKLVGFKRVHLVPGQMQTLNFTVSVDQLSYYDATVAHDFVVDSGNYSLQVGSSSADIRLTNSFSLSLPAVITPGAPGGLSAALYGTNAVLDWYLSSRAAGYTVERAVNPGGPFTVIAGGLTNTTFTDSNLLPGATNYYLIIATNSAGASLPSTLAWVVAPAAIHPVIQTVAFSANGLGFTGNGGSPNGMYYLLGSTNLTTPISNWTRLLTNQFDGGGNFTFTNGLNPNWPQGFYLLQLQ